MIMRRGRRAIQRPVADVSGVPSVAGPRIASLDGVRGIAILLVLLMHFTQDVEPWSRLSWLFLRLTAVGWTGVDLFFVLSGFLITGILCDTKEASGSLFAFYMRRILRIMPLYFVALTLILAVLPTLGMDLGNVGSFASIWFWTYLSNIYLALHGWRAAPRYIQHYWSLAIEEQFYIAWPLIVHWLTSRRLVGVLAITTVGCLGLRLLLARQGFDGTFLYLFTFTRLDGLAAGGCIAVLCRGFIPVNRLRWGCQTICLIALTVCFIRFLIPGGFYRPGWSAMMHAWGLSATTAMFAGFLGWVVTSPESSRLRRRCANRFLVFWGKVSYSVYIFHLPLDFIARSMKLHPTAIMLRTDASSARWLYVLGYIGVLMCLSALIGWLSWHLFEKQILKLRSRFEYGVSSR